MHFWTQAVCSNVPIIYQEYDRGLKLMARTKICKASADKPEDILKACQLTCLGHFAPLRQLARDPIGIVNHAKLCGL